MTKRAPSTEICAQYAAGMIDPALAVLVEMYMTTAPAIAERIAQMRRGFGALLAGEAASPLASDALERALAALDRQDAPPPSPRAPIALDALKWRWAGPGRRVAPIRVPGARFSAFALDVAPGRAMLEHGHQGQEWTLILRGAYRDESGRFGVGDFIEEDSDMRHRPVADDREGCLCVAVLSQPLAVRGLGGVVTRWLLS